MLGEITLTGLTSQGSLSSQVHNWRVGQLLEAVAVARPSAERLQLRIGNAQLEARSQAPIQAGDRVLLKVLTVGSTPTLQVVPATVAAGAGADVVNHTLRQLLPRQLPTERVLSHLLDILKSDQQRSQLPPQTRGLIETLLARIPRAERLADHARLRQLVSESGLFRESHQQRGQSGGAVDIKQALVQLARQLAAARPLQPTPTAENRSHAVVGQDPSNTVSTRPATAAVAGAANSGLSTTGTAPAIAQAPAAASGGANVVQGSAASQASPSTTATVASPGDSRQVAAPRSPDQPQPPTSRQPLNPVVASEVAAREPAVLQGNLLQDLQRQVEGAIARIVLQQAQSLPQPHQEGVRWVFELPYRQGEEYHSLPMVIEREATADEPDQLEAGWQVTLSVELPQLGVVEARILVRGEKVSASLWAERDSTAQLANTELPALETALEANGLEVGALVCRHGQQRADNGAAGGDSLLDYRV